jgi:hypothetical protein
MQPDSRSCANVARAHWPRGVAKMCLMVSKVGKIVTVAKINSFITPSVVRDCASIEQIWLSRCISSVTCLCRLGNV